MYIFLCVFINTQNKNHALAVTQTQTNIHTPKKKDPKAQNISLVLLEMVDDDASNHDPQ